MFLLNGKKRNDIKWQKAKVTEQDFNGKHAVIVGGTNGLGRAIALQMLKHGAKVTVVGRTFRDEGSGLDFIQADLSTLQNAKTAAEKINPVDLDYLILTTGIFSSVTRKANSEGVELDLAVSYLSRYVIMDHLAQQITKSSSGKSRVFIMGFPGMNVKANIDDFNSEKKYNAGTAHYNTIIGNEALVHHYADAPNFNCYGLNPGLIKSDIRTGLTGKGSILTNFIEFILSVIYPDADTYAKSLLGVIQSEDLENRTGLMINRNMDIIHTSKQFKDPSFVQKVIQASKKIVDKVLVEPSAMSANSN